MKVSLNSGMLPSWIEEWISKKDGVKRTASEEKTATVNFKDLPKVTWQDETFGVNFTRQGAELYNSYGNITQVVDGASNMEDVNKFMNENYVVASRSSASFTGNDSTDAEMACGDCDICMDTDEDKDERVILGEDTAIPGSDGVDMVDGASGEITAEVDDEFENELKKVAEVEDNMTGAQQQIVESQMPNNPAEPSADNGNEVTAQFVSKANYNKLLARVKQLERMVKKANISQSIEDMTGEPSQGICNLVHEVSQDADDVAETHHNNNNHGECADNCCHTTEPCACNSNKMLVAEANEGWTDGTVGDLIQRVTELTERVEELVESAQEVEHNDANEIEAPATDTHAEATEMIVTDAPAAETVIVVDADDLFADVDKDIETESESESEEAVIASKHCQSCEECGCGHATVEEHIHHSADELAGEPSQGVDDIAGEPSQGIEDVAKRRTINNESGGMGGVCCASKEEEKECGNFEHKKRLRAFSEAFRAVQYIPNDVYDLKSEEKEVQHFNDTAEQTQAIINKEHELDLSKMSERAKLNEHFIDTVLNNINDGSYIPQEHPDSLVEQIEDTPIIEEETAEPLEVVIPIDESDIENPDEPIEDAVIVLENKQDIDNFVKQICPLCGAERSLEGVGREGNYTAVACKNCGQEFGVEDKTNKIVAHIKG